MCNLQTCIKSPSSSDHFKRYLAGVKEIKQDKNTSFTIQYTMRVCKVAKVKCIHESCIGRQDTYMDNE